MPKPNILLLDIETSPLLVFVWKLHEEVIGLNQIVKDTHLLSFAAKWYGDREIIYQDQSKEKDISNDKKLLVSLGSLLTKADIVVGHNSIKFDTKKINTRMVIHGLQPPKPYKQLDTLEIAKSKFAAVSNKLEYWTNTLCETKKLKHSKFPGFELWKECMKGNPLAWAEMRKYNIADVESLDELVAKFMPWTNAFNPSVYQDEPTKRTCTCGGTDFIKRGFSYTTLGKFQRYKCTACGAWQASKTNLFTKDKRKSLRD